MPIAYDPRKCLMIMGAGLTVVACGYAVGAPGASATDGRTVYDAFAEKDQDRNGVLDLVEFTGGLAGQATRGEARGLFTALDRDHDGILSHEEYFPRPVLGR